MICESHHLGPIVIYPNAGGPNGGLGQPYQLVSRGGGSSCLLTFSGPETDFNTGARPTQGLVAQLQGRQGSRWTNLRQCWAPPYCIGSRQLIQYQGAAVEQFRALIYLLKSGFDPTTWATEIRDFHFDLTVGECGTGGVAPGAGFLLTGHVGATPAGSDQVSIGGSPERRRLIVELLDLGEANAAGCAWMPSDLSPATWIPLRVAEPRVFEVSAPLWVGSDPPGTAIDVCVIEELGLQSSSAPRRATVRSRWSPPGREVAT